MTGPNDRNHRPSIPESSERSVSPSSGCARTVSLCVHHPYRCPRREIRLRMGRFVVHVGTPSPFASALRSTSAAIASRSGWSRIRIARSLSQVAVESCNGRSRGCLRTRAARAQDFSRGGWMSRMYPAVSTEAEMPRPTFHGLRHRCASSFWDSGWMS